MVPELRCVVFWYVFPVVLILAGLSSDLGAAELGVWAIGDGVRIDPLTGKAFEENPDVLPGGLSGEYRNRNFIWDAQSKTVSLKGAANEVLGFQLILEGSGVKGITVSCEGLGGPGGTTIPAKNLTFFRAFYVHVAQKPDRQRAPYPLPPGWFPDPLVPLDTPKLGAPFAIDGSNFGGEAPDGIANQTVWCDLWIPRSAPAGQYTGEILVRYEGGEKKINLNVEVFSFALPDKNHTVVEFMSYNTFAKTDPDQFREMLTLAHQHRATVTNTSTHRIFDPPLEHEDGQFDWHGFDAFWGPAISGTLYTEGPRAGVPMSHFNLPFDPVVNRPDKRVPRKGRGWPIENPSVNDGKEVKFTEEYVREFTSLLQDADRHFAETYPQTTIIVYQDSLDEVAFHVGPLDLALGQMRSIKGYVDIFQRAGLKNTLYKLDIGSGFARCKYDLDGNGVKEGPAEVVKAIGLDVGLWNVHGLCIDLDALQPVMQHGSKVWFYNGFEPRVGPTVIGAEFLGARTWPWVVWNSRMDGMCHWHFLFGSNLKPWVTGGAGAGERENKHPGNAMFLYPGDDVGLPKRAFPSMRLKSIRRGMQDYEYFWLLAESDGNRDRATYFSTLAVRKGMGKDIAVEDFGDDEVAQVIEGRPETDQRHWSHNFEDFEAIRCRIGEILSQQSDPMRK